MERAFAPATLEGYDTGLGHFLDWCDLHGIDESDRCPASEELLCRFVAAQAGLYAGGTVSKWVSAVGAWHKVYGVPWAFAPHSRLTLALRGAAVMTPASSRRPPRDPYTPAYLRRLAPFLDTSTPLDAAVWACAVCAFWGLARTGELVVPTQRSFDPVFHVSRAQARLTPASAGRPAAATLHLPWTKTTRSAGAVMVLAAQEPDLCPVSALRHHLAISPLPDASSLFAYGRPRGPVSLSRSVFLGRMRRAAIAAKLPVLNGHSFRIGGCTELLLRGVAIEDVKAHGRWRSDAWTAYVRSHTGVFSSRLSTIPGLSARLLPG
ncbi:hypothetical protein CF319_g1266 [Tilletia indica]|nr:hypothetical protein CF319_g1266 [Tilletia indica]